MISDISHKEGGHSVHNARELFTIHAPVLLTIQSIFRTDVTLQNVLGLVVSIFRADVIWEHVLVVLLLLLLTKVGQRTLEGVLSWLSITDDVNVLHNYIIITD